MKKLVFTLLTIMTLTACSFGWKDQASDTKETSDREALFSTYSPLQGVYSGTLTSADGTVTKVVEIDLTLVEMPDGKNGDKENRYVPALKALYKLPNETTSDIDMDVRFFKENRNIVMTNLGSSQSSSPSPASSQGNPSNSQQLTISGTVSANNDIVGTVTRGSEGVVGYINLIRTSNVPVAPISDITDKDNLKKMEIYKKVAGTFEGLISPENPNDPQIPIRLVIYVYRRYNTQSGKVEPYLYALYHRLDMDNRVLDRTMTVQYFPDQTPPLMAMDSGDRSSNTAKNGIINTFYSFDVHIDNNNNHITGMAANQAGPMGNVDLTRKEDQQNKYN